MPGMMNRASTIVKAKINKLLNRAEDPGETLDYSYEKQLELLQNVKRGVADVVTVEEAAGDADVDAGAERGQAGRPGAPGAAGRPGGSRARSARSARRSRRSSCRGSTSRSRGCRRSRRSSSRARSSSRSRSRRSARRRKSSRPSTPPPRRRCGSARPRRASASRWRTRVSPSSAPRTRPSQMQARASAVDELVESGALEDFTTGGETDLDRELRQLATRDASR